MHTWMYMFDSHMLLEMWNSTTTLEKCLAVSLEWKHTLALWSSKSTPRNLPQRIENISPQNDVCKHVYSIFIHNRKILRIAQVFFQWKYKLLYSCKIHTTKWTNLKNIRLCEKSQTQKILIFYDPISNKL